MHTPHDSWLDICAEHELPVGAKRIVPFRQIEIAIFHLPDGFVAVKNACPHAGQSLGRGTVVDGVVTCPGHNWQFRLDSGECLRGDTTCTIRTFAVEVKNGRVMVNV